MGEFYNNEDLNLIEDCKSSNGKLWAKLKLDGKWYKVVDYDVPANTITIDMAGNPTTVKLNQISELKCEI